MASPAGDAAPAGQAGAPAGVTRLEVRGFRTARAVELRPGPLTALVGEASAGKSNLLAAMRLLLDPAGPSLGEADAADGGDGVISVVAALAGGGLARLERDASGVITAERRDAPAALFLPSELRAGSVIAAPAARGPAAGAAALLADAVAEQTGPHLHRAATVGASGLVAGLERCCAAGAHGVVVLVEEPELYLRPQAQRYLYRLLHELATAGNQVVYSTHAPAFLNVARLEELAVVTRHPTRGTVVTRPDALPGGEDFRAMSEFDAERSELFLADVAVLVEGRTEKLALPHMFRALGYDPDRYGISVVECGGKANIPVLAQVCRSVGVTTVVIHDRDAAPGRLPIVTERRLNDVIATLVPPERLIVLEPDFEGVSGLHRHHHKPEQAWRRFRSLGPAEVPAPLARAVSLAVSLVDGHR